MNGYGEFFWNDGKKYFGFYKEDKREGFGLHYQPNKYIFAGFWNNGQKNGLGKYIKGKSIKYGIWKNGKKEKLFEDNEDFYKNLKGDKKIYMKIFNWTIEDTNKFMGIKQI